MTTDWFQKWSGYQPEKTAVKVADGSISYTYEEINNSACELSNYFIDELNIRKGDRILILSSFNPEYISLFSVAQKTGIILVPVNYRLSAAEIAYLVKNSDPSLIIYEEQFSDLLKDVNNSFQSGAIKWSELKSRVEKSKNTLQVFKNIPVESDHPCLILYTSGTTGFPKGAIYTHGMMLWNSLNTAIRLRLTSDDTTLMVMPPFHTGGWNVLTTPVLHFGGTIILMPKFDSGRTLQLLESEKISIFMAVPTMVKMMMEENNFTSIDFSKLRYMIVGGEALPVNTIEKWAECGVPIRQGYGLTEAGPNITSLEAEDAIRKRGSIGFPNFYVKTRLVKEDGTDALPDESGELWISGPVVTPGYWRNKEATRKAFSEEWFKTGDILKSDTDGYLYVVDRIKNMFISGGENVYPAEVERRILEHDLVSEAAVIGVPDKKWGEVGKAYIVVRENCNLSEEEINAFCKDGLAKFKVPKFFIFLHELPKNDTGKIDRKQLSIYE
ncbi:long-chain fatty acid--CoA ligase [Mangrovivirga sp. M17]|uniref:Long-chain fatty acid--CoA ligase n=1 Tax=Mangrovivirga halotolerans TaxID=2993936 RepID=A0ABT3RN47_9BACT|nr:long-chain fatty acid--CoA ligase [Mangrovivirga halotolerans]MCX2743022.1 long-chain fatty acid--CoA ligase [Mangrovivirga halotolerans]